MSSDSDTWKRVKEILGQALDLDFAERGDFIRNACGDDAELRAEVESLAAHHGTVDHLLENPGITAALTLRPDLMLGRMLGAYRIVGRLGEGGMAMVYLGERADEQFHRTVAIKMVKPGPHSEEVYRRFRNERQTLASIDHPNIVKLLDGGTTAEGWPYFVMEYVDGVPIDRYCDGQRLSLESRLRLFCTVCCAVQYAHERTIVHRDLKPANILITKEGVPRLLDFGIAKLLAPQLPQTALITRTSLRPMTPEYASPEQVRGESVTQASDVYSLGVLLYGLLTGHTPYAPAGSSLVDMERAICEQEPELPSAAVGRAEPGGTSDEKPRTAEPIGSNRGADPRQLRRLLRGDLDTIALAALRKQPAQRYHSVAEFAGDIERYLNAEPIAARRISLADRSAAFARRHRESLATAAVVLVVMASVAVWETQRAARPIATQLSAAVPAHRPTVAVLGFKNLSGRTEIGWVSTALTEMFDTELAAGDRLRMVPAETVARARMDLGLPETQTLAADTLARLRRNLGSDFVVLGSYLDLRNPDGEQIRLDLRAQDVVRGETVATVSEAGAATDLLTLVSHAANKLRRQLGVAESSLADATGIHASIPSNPQAMRLYAEGLTELRAFDALAARDLLVRAVIADPSYPLAHSMLSKAWLALGYGQNATAEAKKALDVAGNLSRADHALLEARFYETSKQWEQATETYQQLFASFPDNPEYGLDLANAQVGAQHGSDALKTLATLRSAAPHALDDARVDLAEAEAAYTLADNKRVLLATGRAIQTANTSGVKLVAARAYVLRCRAYASLGKPALSSAAGAEARRRYEQAGDPAGEAQALHAMAEIPIDQGDLEQAKTLYTQALEIVRRIGDKRGTARELGNIGLIYVQQGDFSTGERLYAEALADFKEVGDRQSMAVVVANTGDVRHAQARLGDALAEYREALMLAREAGHKAAEGIDLQLIGDVLADQGDLDGAMQMYQQASTVQRAIADNYYYSITLISIGRVHRLRADSTGARTLYDQALAMRRQLAAKGLIAEAQMALAELAGDAGQGAAEESLARQAAHEFQVERESDLELHTQGLLVESLLQQNALERAGDALQAGLALYDRSRDVTVRLPFQIQNAYATAAKGDFTRARQLAHSVRLDAEKCGLVRIALEAELAECAIRLKQLDSAAIRAELARLASDARAKGFTLLARKAQAELDRLRLKPT
jgi:serine/threonine protein kinase/tetratricopeptide (TPR) repeat protein